jgi:hypothetical protein
VDETGRSTIILLPSCPVGWKDIERDCITGSISVTTIMGKIWLTKPFESVTVNSGVQKPQSAILNLSLDQINNLIIVTPPRQVIVQETTVTKAYNFLDEDLLGQDLLAYGELSKDYLKEYNKLDRNYLDSDFLMNLLDVSSSQLLGNELTEFNGLLPKYNAASGLKYFVENDYVTLYRETSSSYAEVKVSTNNSLTLNITQDNITITQMVNSAGTTSINIKQSN